MAETFGKKPWITYDQVDENGVRAEVLVQSGVGIVESLKESKSGKAYNVRFSVDNNEHGYNGNVSKTEEIAKEIEKAYENKTPIGFRIEKRRKDFRMVNGVKEAIDRSIPMSELSPPRDMAAAADNTYKSLVAVLPEGSEEWMRSKFMKTRFEEDPVENGPTGGSYDVDLDTFTGGQSKGAPGASATPPTIHKERSLEAPPFSDYNNDGSVNLGSVSVGVPLNILFFVSKYCKDNGVSLDDDQQKAVAAMILKISNTLQKKIYKEQTDIDLKKPMLSAGSHSRARQIAFELIDLKYPITEELTNDQAFKTWGKQIIEEGLNLWLWSLEESSSALAR